MSARGYDEILESMRQRYRELAGFDADSASDIGIRLQVLAHQAHQAVEELEELRTQVFAQTSTGRYLELHAETRGLTRKSARSATGVLRFWRETPAGSDIPIAKGVLCATRPEPQMQYETLESAVLPRGELWVEVPARAVESGAAGNAAPESVCLMITPAPGISGVISPQAFTGGVDAEGDEALRERLLRSFRNISNGANAAFYYDLAMGWEGVASARVLPRQRGRGTVDVVVACHEPAGEAAVVAEIAGALSAQKEINVDVAVYAAQRDVTDIRAEISIGDGYDPGAVLEACRETAERFLAGLGVGATLLLARLGSALLEVDGVYNYRILAPAGDREPLNDHMIQAGEIAVTRMAVG